MQHHTRSSFLATTLALCALLSLPLPLLAQEGSGASTGNVTVTVTQEGPAEGAAGEWTMLKPDRKRVEMGKKITHTFTNAAPGQYTIFAIPPSGASATIDVEVNGGEPLSVDVPQMSFTAEDGSTVNVRITFTYTSVGKISVNSTPAGLSFHMEGPDDRDYTGATPAEYLNAPIGLYSLTYDPIPGCMEPKPKSDQLTKNGRITFSINVVCENMDLLPQAKVVEKSLQHVTVTLNGERVTFTDVPLEAWFAASVNTAIRTGIMSGYRNPDGSYTGSFGPADTVTLAQLAKVAHRIGDIDEREERTLPENARAKDTWFADFYASAERRNWLAFRNPRENPERAATRAEVVCTLLQSLNVPRIWPTGKRFSDVASTALYADCIETAANDGLVSGDAASGTFDPERTINRAELSKILVSAMNIYKEKTAEIRGNYDGVK